LLVIDLQHGTLGAMRMSHASGMIVANANALMTAFRQRRLPVCIVTNLGSAPGTTSLGTGGLSWPPEAIEPLGGLEIGPSDLRFEKRAWGAFGAKDLDKTLRGAGVFRVVLAGVATSYGIESTAREAYDLGYDVVVIADAVTDPTLEEHERVLTRTIPILGCVSDTATVVESLR
jgi:nicotinamidase-related amidase